jgi:Flp pilus assembly protein CpaB
VRRSSRVILLLGIFLAVGAFLLIVFLGGGGRPSATPTPAIARLVIAVVDIPQGTTITESMLRVDEIALVDAPGDGLSRPELVVGKTARQSVVAGAYVPQAAITGTTGAANIAAELKAGERAMAVTVDEFTGVGTLIQPGDRVDVVFTFTQNDADQPDIPVTFILPRNVPAPACDTLVCETGILLSNASVKLIVQNVRVVGTILSAVPAPSRAAEATPTPQPGTALTGRTELVIVAVSAQQAEVLRFGQLLKAPITMLLRSPADAAAAEDTTTGIILKTLLDKYGVLPPQPIAIPLPSEFVPR